MKKGTKSALYRLEALVKGMQFPGADIVSTPGMWDGDIPRLDIRCRNRHITVQVLEQVLYGVSTKERPTEILYESENTAFNAIVAILQEPTYD